MSTRSNNLISLSEAVNSRTATAVPSKQLQHRLYRLAIFLSDGVMVTLAFALAYWFRFDLSLTLHPEIVPVGNFYPLLTLFFVPIWLCLFSVFRAYDSVFLFGGTKEYQLIFNACTTGTMVIVILTFAQPTFVVARGWLLFSWMASLVLVSSGRFLLRRTAYALRRKGLFLEKAAIVGVDGEAVALAEQLKEERSSGLRVVGFIEGAKAMSQNELSGLPRLGRLSDVESIIAENSIEELIVPAMALEREELLNLCERVDGIRNVELRLSSGLFEILTAGVRVKTIGSVPLMSFNKLRLDPLELFVKTAFEYLITMTGVFLLAPLFLLIALCIKLDSPGPVFFRRRVLGLGRRQFDAFKFRTMFVDGEEILAEHEQLGQTLRQEHKLKFDPRVTRCGRWLRRYSLDELPQLFNVLLGQMSLVGPRMISPGEESKYGRLKLNLLTVKPGLTGLWQVSGRSDLSYQERVRLDMYYIRNYSLWRDLQILFVQTLPVVLKGKGAY